MSGMGGTRTPLKVVDESGTSASGSATAGASPGVIAPFARGSGDSASPVEAKRVQRRDIAERRISTEAYLSPEIGKGQAPAARPPVL